MIKLGQSKSDSLTSDLPLSSILVSLHPARFPLFSSPTSPQSNPNPYPFFPYFFKFYNQDDLRMRESNFAFPAQNRAAVCISSQLYDRRGAPIALSFFMH